MIKIDIKLNTRMFLRPEVETRSDKKEHFEEKKDNWRLHLTNCVSPKSRDFASNRLLSIQSVSHSLQSSLCLLEIYFTSLSLQLSHWYLPTTLLSIIKRSWNSSKWRSSVTLITYTLLCFSCDPHVSVIYIRVSAVFFWTFSTCSLRSFIYFRSVFLTMFAKTLLSLRISLYLPAVVSVCVSLSLSLCLSVYLLSLSLSHFPFPLFFLCLRLVVGWCRLLWNCLPSFTVHRRIYFLVACRHEMIHNRTVRAIIAIIIYHVRSIHWRGDFLYIYVHTRREKSFSFSLFCFCSLPFVSEFVVVLSFYRISFSMDQGRGGFPKFIRLITHVRA